MEKYKVGDVANIISGKFTLDELDESAILYSSVGRSKNVNKLTTAAVKYCHGVEDPEKVELEETQELDECDLLKSGENENSSSNREERTIFVGNLPISVKKLKVKKWFSKFGEIEAIRFRCTPISSLRNSKKVSAMKKNFHEKRTSHCAFIRFVTQQSAEAALVANGVLFNNTHSIRVDSIVNKNQYDKKKSIFIGNMPFDAEEEDIRQVFENCGKIESIRIIRDHVTGVGKGFGYVNFENDDAVELAVNLNGVAKVNKRDLRVKRTYYDKKTSTNICNKKSNHRKKKGKKKIM